jgi:hypothetical protein
MIRSAAALLSLVLANATLAAPTVRFLAERLPEGVDEVVMLAEEKASESFKPPTKYLTQELAPPARAFELRTATDRLPLGRVTLPDAGDQFIVLLLPHPEKGFRSVVLRADQPGFRAGDCYLHNDTESRIVGYIGDKRFQFKPGEGGSVRPIEKVGRGFHDVGFGVDVEADGGIRALSMTRWPIDSQIRSYVFFFVNARTGRIDYRAVDEFISPAKAE